jgi:hypothetical protein
MARPSLVASTAAFTLILYFGLALIIIRSNGAKRYKPLNRRMTHKFPTFRISNIPREVTEDQFRDILTSLPIKVEGLLGQPNLLGFSYSPAAVSGLAERYWVATGTFEGPLVSNDLETAIKRKIGVGAARLKVDLDFFGITPLYDPPQNTDVE